MRRDIRRPCLRHGAGDSTAIPQTTREVHRMEEKEEQYIQHLWHGWCQEWLYFETGERDKVCYGLSSGGMLERKRFDPMTHCRLAMGLRSDLVQAICSFLHRSRFVIVELGTSGDE